MRPALLVVAALLVASSAFAQTARDDKTRKRRARAPAKAPAKLEIPIEVAAGPILLVPSPPAVFDQPAHFGLQLELAAVVTQDLIRKHKNQIPPWARGVAGNLREAKVRPLWLAIVPDTIVISPQLKDTGMYGAMWRPFGLGVPLIDTDAFRAGVGANIMAAALLVHSNVLGVGAGGGQAFTFVLRPGITLRATAEVPLGDTLAVHFGWSSDFFVPQPFGRTPWELAPLEDSLWHLGGPFLTLAYRFPLDVGEL